MKKHISKIAIIKRLFMIVLFLGIILVPGLRAEAACKHDWDTQVEATCTKGGKEECTICHRFRDTNALGHDPGKTKRKATCSQTGIMICKRCNGEYEIPKIDHTWQTLSKPNCSSTGTDECEVCHTPRHPGKNNDHDYQDATCKAPQTCRRCGDTIGNKGDHKWIPATCSYEEHCRTCGTTRGKKVDHDWDIQLEATCSNTGHKECAVCHKPETIPIDSNNHKASAPTCKKDSVCSRCNTKVKDALGHDWDYQKEATCVSGGYRECFRCHEGGSIDATGIHKYENGECKYCGEPQQSGPSTQPTEDKDTNIDKTKDADPVNSFSGAHEIDLSVMKLGGVSGISLGLNYKSDKAVSGLFGKGFSYNYESFLELDEEGIRVYHSPSNYVVYTLSDEEEPLDKDTSYYYTDAVGSETDVLIYNEASPIELQSHGYIYYYSTKDPGYPLMSVTDKTGEMVYITYSQEEIDITDAASGQTISLILNDKGLVSEVNNYLSGGTLKATFTYDENGCLTGYTDLEGYTTGYAYDDTCRIISATDADGNTYFTDTFDENGRVCEQRDAEGNVSYFVYEDDEEGYRTTTFTDREGAVKTYVFTPEGRLISETDACGNTKSREYDDRGNVIKTTDGLGNISLFEYDERGNLTRSEDALGNVNTYIYDDRDNLLSLTNGDGETIRYVYDARNRLVSSTDLRGLTTIYEYNDNSQLIKTTAQDRIITYGYDEAGNLVSVKDPDGNETVTSYDSNDHVTGNRNALGAESTVVPDAFGDVLASTDPYGNRSADSNHRCGRQ